MRFLSPTKVVHFFTAFVYLFTTLGPSLSHATNTITLVEVIEEQTTLPTLRLNTRKEEYKRYDLSITPENSNFRQGIHFHFQDYYSPELSLETFVNLNGPFPHSNFSPLIQKDLQTGFTVSLPNFGQIQCDWQGNLKLVGLHKTEPQADPISLLLSTKGNLDISDVTFNKLTLHAKKATFVKGVKIQEESVFDIEVLDLANSEFENKKIMHFLSKARFVSKKIWRNRGGIFGEKSLFFDNASFCNLGRVSSKGRLRFSSPYFNNSRGIFHGDRGVSVALTSYFYNREGGKITSGGLTRLKIGRVNDGDLGNISGKRVILEDTSGAEHFILKNGKVTAQNKITLLGNAPHMTTIKFHTPQLFLEADRFDLGVLNDIERTVVLRSKDQGFTLTEGYETNGTLEFWQQGLTTFEAVQEAMAERFGDETREMPEHESVIDLQASVKAAGGLAFFTPHAKIRLGDGAKEDLLDFTAEEGWLEAYATLFDLEKGTLVAEGAYIHAPAGILTGRLDKDAGGNLFSENLYTQNGSTLLVRGTTTLRGPWHHRGDCLSSFLVLDSPRDHLFEVATGRVLQDCELKGGGDLYLKRRTSEWHIPAAYLKNHRIIRYINSPPSYFTIDGNALFQSSKLINELSIVHIFQRSDSSTVSNVDVRISPKMPQNLMNVVFLVGRNLSFYNMFETQFTHSNLEQLCSIHRYSQPVIGINGFIHSLHYQFGNDYAYPAQTSFGTDTTVMPDETGVTKLLGDFQAPLTVVMIDQGGAEVGSVPTLSLQTTYTHSQRQSLVPEAFNLGVTMMAENLRRLMEQKPLEETFFRFQPRFWFDEENAQQFHKQLRPYVRVKNRNGGFDTLSGQALFTLSPDMLIAQVQEKALKVLGRGTIEDYRKIDEDQVLELHHNFVEYLEEIGFDGTDLTGALMDPKSCLPLPKKPFICYQSTVNEEGIAELSPIIWLPQEMHKAAGIQTRLLLTIPMGMSFNDLMALAQSNEMLQPALQKLLTDHSQLVPKIDRLALKYREDNGFTEDEELPPMGEITLNGKIRADDFFILNTGNVINHADVECQDALLMSLFGNVIMSSVVERERYGNDNFQDRILAQARLEASNLIKIFAGQDIIFQGAETISEVSTHILALARIFDIPAVLVSQRTEQLSGKYNGTETWMHIHNHVSRHSSGGSFKQEAVGTQELCGGQYAGDFIDILAEGDIEITDAVDHFAHSFSGKKSSGTRSKKRQESEQRQTSRGAGFHARKAPTNLESRKGNLGLTAPQFTGGHGATLSAPLGEVMIRLGRESFEKSSSSTMTSSTWNKMVQKTEKHLTFSVPTSDGPVKIKALKTIVETIQGKELELLEKLEILDGELVKLAVAELHEYDETVIESLGGPAAAVIAIAVSCITAGAAGPLMAGLATSLGMAAGGTAATAFAAAFTAGAASLASQAAVSLISNQGDLGKVVKEITASQALRSLATSMVTAGLVAGAGELMNGATTTATSVGENATTVATQSIDQGVTQTSTLLESTVSTSTKAFDIGERIQDALIRASSETFVNSTIGGQDFEESIISAARSGVANVAGGFFAHKWGVEYKDVDSQIDYFTHKLVHGIIGAGMGAISDGEALAGFIGATVGEMVGEAYADAHPEGFNPDADDYDPKLRKSYTQNGKTLTQISAALAAAFLDQNPNVAACTALNAVTENSFATTPNLQRQTVEETGEIIGYVLENSPAESTEELVGDFYEVLSSLDQLDLSEDQALEIAIGLAEKISEHGDSISGRQLNQFIQRTFLEHVSPTAEREQFIEDVANLGQLGGQKVSEFLGGSEDIQLLTGELGKIAGTGLAFGMSLYDNPASSGAKKVVKETAKKVAKESTKKTAKKVAKKPQTYEVKAGKEWKAKIKGRAQVTGGKKNRDVVHSWKSRKEAIKVAKRSDVTEVQMDLGVNRLLPKGSKIGPKGNRRPDVAYKTKDGKIHQIEVPSRTDVRDNLLRRMENTRSNFPDGMQGNNKTIIRNFD